MMAMTTSSSISVKPDLWARVDVSRVDFMTSISWGWAKVRNWRRIGKCLLVAEQMGPFLVNRGQRNGARLDRADPGGDGWE